MVSVVSAQEIRVVAELLQISPEALQKSITYKVTVGLTHVKKTCMSLFGHQKIIQLIAMGLFWKLYFMLKLT